MKNSFKNQASRKRSWLREVYTHIKLWSHLFFQRRIFKPLVRGGFGVLAKCVWGRALSPLPPQPAATPPALPPTAPAQKDPFNTPLRASPCRVQNNSFWSQHFSIIYSKSLMGSLVLLTLFRCGASGELVATLAAAATEAAAKPDAQGHCAASWHSWRNSGLPAVNECIMLSHEHVSRLWQVLRGGWLHLNVT